MITVEQIKAARGLLEWTQDDLADVAIISRPALNNLERRQTKPHSETLKRIRKALEKAGVEFIDGGVRFVKHVLNVQVLEGESAIYRWAEDIFDTLVGTDGELLIAGVNEREFIEYGGNKFLKYIDKLHDHDIHSKLLLEHGDTYLIEPVEYYRWVSSEIFAQVPYATYGDKYSIILWGPPQKIIIIENPDITESYRKQFEVHWKNAEIPIL